MFSKKINNKISNYQLSQRSKKMKLTYTTILTILMSCLGISCGPQQRPLQQRTAIPPGGAALVGAVTLMYQGGLGGPVNNLRLTVNPPPGSVGSLLDQTGTVQISGQISVNNQACLGTRLWPFTCPATMSFGNINANNCRIGNIIANLQIILTRRLGLQNPNAYNIQNVVFNAPPQVQCQFQPGFATPPIVPGGGIPPVVPF